MTTAPKTRMRRYARHWSSILGLMKRAMRRVFHTPRAGRSLPPLPTFDRGGALVDVADRDALYQAMEGR